MIECAHSPTSVTRSARAVRWLNKEIKRRTGVVGIFPTRASGIRLGGMIQAECDDEWQDGRRYVRHETNGGHRRC